MTIDNNKSLLTEVSSWFIVEVYTMRKIPGNGAFS